MTEKPDTDYQCDDCEGTGKLVLHCKTCEGNGWVEDPSDGGTKTCPTCDDEACPTCKGSGEKP